MTAEQIEEMDNIWTPFHRIQLLVSINMKMYFCDTSNGKI